MGLFTRATKPALLPSSAVDPDEGRFDQSELQEAVDRRIEAAMRKSLSYANYIAFDNLDDQSGYFGTEFEIRTTAGRLKGLYSREPWIYTSATYIAKNLASIPMKVWTPGEKGKLVPGHWLQPMLDGGSPIQSAIELRWAEGVDLMLGGNYFLLLEPDLRSIAGLAPVEMVSLRYKPDYSGLLGIEVYAIGAGNKTAFFPIEQIVHIKMPNPSNFNYGMSPFAAAARPILLDRYKNEYEMAFYLRGATHQGVIETTEDLSKSRFQRLMRTFEQAFTGRSNWWRTLFLPKGAKWNASSLTMNEMQHLEGLKENRKTILAVLGIPPSMVGLIEDVNRATAEQQERIFWNNTVVPLAHFVAAGWNQSYLVKTILKGKVEIRPDFSGIEAVEGFSSAKAEKAKGMEPFFSINEIRQKVWGAEPSAEPWGNRLTAEIKGAGIPPIGGPGGAALALPPGGTKSAIPEGFVCICVMCPKSSYPTKESAVRWATSKNYKTDHVEEAADHWRLQQQGPDGCIASTVRTYPLDDGCSGLFGQPVDPNEAKERRAASKAVATTSQNRIEGRLSAELERTFKAYVEDLLLEARKAVQERRVVRQYLEAKRSDRASAWVLSALPTLEKAMERGFSAASSQVKAYAYVVEKRSDLFPGLDETDKQAVDVLRERTRDGRRRTLQERGVDHFLGFDATTTDNIMKVIETGERAGRSYEEIARTIREDYGEAYDGQARTIVRTEILTAVSQGLDWNHQVLREVFTEVRKEWLHQGDEGINSDARQEHVELDGTEVSGDNPWTYTDPKTGEAVALRYPRDPSAPPGATINCRCTMISVIPEQASSNAEAILNS